MVNPFDDESSSFRVIVNDEGQHSLWPSRWPPTPAGWQVVFGPDDRSRCLEYVAAHWTDLRPRSLAGRMTAGRSLPPEPADGGQHA